MKRGFVIGMVLMVTTGLVCSGQSNEGKLETQRKIEEAHSNKKKHPENIRLKEDIRQADDAAAKKPGKEKKKRKCWFSRKKKKQDAAAPDNTDAMKDRNIHDPKLKQPVKPAEKAKPFEPRPLE